MSSLPWVQAILAVAGVSLVALRFMKAYFPSMHNIIMNALMSVILALIDLIVPLIQLIPIPSALADFHLPAPTGLIGQLFYALGFNTCIALIGAGVTIRFLRACTFFLK